MEVGGARWDPEWDTVEAWRAVGSRPGGAVNPGNDAWWVYGVCGFAVALLGHRVLQGWETKMGEEAPFSGEDANPLWLQALAWIFGCFLWLGELPVVKVPREMFLLAIFVARRLPLYVQSLLAQRGARVWRDVQYGPRPRNRLDVYWPEPAGAGGSPPRGRAVIMMVHGGAWYWGDKLYFAKVQGASFPDSIVVPINYTLHPHADCEQMVKDVSLAIAWTYQNLCRAEGLPLVVMGHSAGAHLVMLCATYRCLGSRAPSLLPLVPRPLVPWPWEPEHVAAFVGCSGVYHISEHYLHEKTRGVHLISPMCGNKKTTPAITTAGKAPPVMGLDPARWDMYSPRSVVEAAFARPAQEAARVHFEQRQAGDESAAIHQTGNQGGSGNTPAQARAAGETRLAGGGGTRSSRLPRIVLFHGSDDGTVPVQASVRFYETLTRCRQDCSLHYIAGGEHTEATCMCLADTSSIWRFQLAADILHAALAPPSSSPQTPASTGLGCLTPNYRR